MSKYNLEGINDPSKKNGWKTFEGNNLRINVLCTKREKMCPVL